MNEAPRATIKIDWVDGMEEAPKDYYVANSTIEPSEPLALANAPAEGENDPTTEAQTLKTNPAFDEETMAHSFN